MVRVGRTARRLLPPALCPFVGVRRVGFAGADLNLPRKDVLLPSAKIDIDRLTQAELIDLNRRIVERLRFLNQMRAHAEMLEVSIGERVSFQPQGRPEVVGMLTRYNRKTVTLITEDGQQWNVSPQLLRRLCQAAGTEAPDPKDSQLPPE